MIDVRKLILLREVAVHAGISNAARALDVSPSSISQQITRLEEQTGATLLTPAGRGVKLTAEAVRLVAHAETILATLEEAQSELAASRAEVGGILHIAGFHTFAIELLGPVTKNLRQMAPSLSLAFTELDPDDAIGELSARRVDVVIADEYPGVPFPPTRGLNREQVGQEPIYAVTPFATTDLETLPWAMEPRQSDSFRWARSICRSAGFEPQVRFESPDPFVHRRLAEQGLAAAFLPAIVARGLRTPAAVVSGTLLGGLHRTLVTLVRRGTQNAAPIRACRKAIALAFDDAGITTPPR